jgi:hypothetical protein
MKCGFGAHMDDLFSQIVDLSAVAWTPGIRILADADRTASIAYSHEIRAVSRFLVRPH